MLLLLLLLSKISIKDQFEIWQGVTTVRNQENKSGKKQTSGGYKVINLSGINSCTGLIDESSLIDFYPSREIPRDKLLTSSDYLITCKGEVKGFSMLFSEEILSNFEKISHFRGVVASNHFLVLRPRLLSGTTIDEIRFLHNLLDIISTELRLAASGKSGNAKYLTISDVANYKFNFPFKKPEEIRKFDTLMSDYLEKLNELNAAKARLDKYNKSLAAKIIISQSNDK